MTKFTSNDNRVKIYNQDCMEGMKNYPDGYFDIAIVDPNWGIGASKFAYLSEHKTKVTQKNGNRLNPKNKRSCLEKKNWDDTKPEASYFLELMRISKEQIIWGIEYFPEINDLIGDGRIKWDKCLPDGLSFKGYEIAYCSLIEDEITFEYLWNGMMQGKSLLSPTIQQGNKRLNEKKIHPTQKPVKLYKWLYKNYTEKGCKVLDTHLGSGSNAIAAHYFGVSEFVGYELDVDYFTASITRFKEQTSQLVLEY